MTKMISRKTTGLTGTAKAPGDKSISHRALMLGGLAEGESKIEGLLEGEDVLATAAAMEAMGATIVRPAHPGGTWRVTGVGARGLRSPEDTLDMGNSGTSARLLTGVIAGAGVTARLTGDDSLKKRPMGRVITPLELCGARFEPSDGGRLPMTVRGTKTPRPVSYTLPVASAQVKSAVLLAGLNAEGITEVVEPKPTRNHSELMLGAMGARIEVTPHESGGNTIRLHGPARLHAVDVAVPADPSSAAFLAVAALITEDSDILIPNVGINATRRGLYDTLVEMGGDVTFELERSVAGEPVADIRVRSSALKGVTVPPDRAPSMIDEYPVLAVAAACADGATRMAGIGELRVKESDRVAMTVEGLEKCGVSVTSDADSMTVSGAGRPPKGGGAIRTALDHRIAMSFLVLGCATQNPVEIDDGAPIMTSFPGFDTLMNGLGGKIALSG